MSFDALIAKVRQAEDALEASERRTTTQWRQVATTWRSAWTPGRIVVAGLALGFLTGRAQPLKLAGNGGLLNLVSALSGLFASAGAQAAADDASTAADAAVTAADAANATPVA